MLHPLRTSTPEAGTRRPRPLLRTTLGVVLRRNRLEQGRTLADVAGAAKVSMQYLSELERGRKEASSEVLAALCEALELDLPDVLAEVGRRLTGSGETAFVRLTGGLAADRPGAAGLEPPAAGSGPDALDLTDGAAVLTDLAGLAADPGGRDLRSRPQPGTVSCLLAA